MHSFINYITELQITILYHNIPTGVARDTVSTHPQALSQSPVLKLPKFSWEGRAMSL